MAEPDMRRTYLIKLSNEAGALPMASNFQITFNRHEDSMHLRLYGDFDGSSAHELINLLKG